MSQITTDEQYERVIQECKSIFLKKTKDYGTSWRVYRPISVADQLYIKAKRIRNIQDGFAPKVDEDILVDFKGIINYSVIGLMQGVITHDEWELPVEEVEGLYDRVVKETTELFHKKNHDYGEAWRDMSLAGITDLILAKILRIRKIVQNKGKTIASEGIDSNYMDILIYAVFALILSDESNDPK